MKLCLPAIVYLTIGIISTLYTTAVNKIEYINLLFSIIFIVVWTFLLNLICSSGYTVISWILVLFPFIIFLFVLMIGLFGLSQLSKDEKKDVVNELNKKN